MPLLNLEDSSTTQSPSNGASRKRKISVCLRKKILQTVNLKMKIPTLLLLTSTLVFGQNKDRKAPRQFDSMRVVEIPAEIADTTMALSPKFVIFGEKNITEGETLPLVICLHGGGGGGDDPRRIAGMPNGVYRMTQSLKENCLVVGPQCTKKQRGGNGQGQDAGQDRGCWFASDLNVLLKYLKDNFPINDKRIYLTGSSMGGYGTYHWAGNNPEHFAAILPIVGGIGEQGPKDISPKLSDWAKNIATIPMKTFYGAQDKVVPAEMGKKMLAEIKKHGGTKAELIIFPDAGHNAGKNVMSNPDYFKWLLSQVKE